MDESRKAHEEWFRSRYGSLSIPPEQRLVMRTYSWAAWQASRAAIEIELTDIYKYLAKLNDETLSLAFCRLAEGVRAGDAAAIRAAGIKVKE